ncbi:hypothetical protein P5673_020745, partial [Acropora cervicornis]
LRVILPKDLDRPSEANRYACTNLISRKCQSTRTQGLWFDAESRCNDFTDRPQFEDQEVVEESNL